MGGQQAVVAKSASQDRRPARNLQPLEGLQREGHRSLKPAQRVDAAENHHLPRSRNPQASGWVSGNGNARLMHSCTEAPHRRKPIMKTIPKSLLGMLAQKWHPADPEEGEGGAFESIFAEEDRARDPSFYISREGEPSASAMLQFDEVIGLLRDGVLTSTTAAVRHYPSGARYTATNEHAQHAIYDFCQAVYAAWDQLQQ